MAPAPTSVAHGGPCPYEDPVVIHSPNSLFGHSDQMQSMHPAGANILMGDGAVEIYLDDAALGVWVAMISRNGGDSVEQGVSASFMSTGYGAEQ